MLLEQFHSEFQAALSTAELELKQERQADRDTKAVSRLRNARQARLDRLYAQTPEMRAELYDRGAAIGEIPTNLDARFAAIAQLLHKLHFWHTANPAFEERFLEKRGELTALNYAIKEMEFWLSRLAALERGKAKANQQDTPALPDPMVNAGRRRLSRGQVLEKATELAKKHKLNFLLLDDEKQAEQIGCDVRTWRGTDYHATVARLRGDYLRRVGKEQPVPTPKAVSLTPALEAVHDGGQKRDAVLDEAIANEEAQRHTTAHAQLEDLLREQKADFEPSPLNECSFPPKKRRPRA